jgi:hypothetical protein
VLSDLPHRVEKPTADGSRPSHHEAGQGAKIGTTGALITRGAATIHTTTAAKDQVKQPTVSSNQIAQGTPVPLLLAAAGSDSGRGARTLDLAGPCLDNLLILDLRRAARRHKERIRRAAVMMPAKPKRRPRDHDGHRQDTENDQSPLNHTLILLS